MKQTKFIQPKVGWYRVLAYLGLFLFSAVSGKAQVTPPEDYRIKVKFDQQTKFQVALFAPTDLERLSVLDQMSLTQSTESSTVEIFYQKEDRATTLTTFHKTPADGKSWMPFVKYSVLDGRMIQLYNEQGKLLQEMDMGKEFEGYSKMAIVPIIDGAGFKFPTAFDYDDMAQNYEDQGFSVTSLAEGKVWIENSETQIEMDLLHKKETTFSKDSEGTIKRIGTTHFFTLASGHDVPVFSETIEYDHFPNGVCYQKIRADRFLNYEIVRPDIEERALPTLSASALNISISPNPVGYRLHLQGVTLSASPLWCSISDLTGKVYQTMPLTPQSLSSGINVSDLHSGVYFLTVRSQDEVKTIKFVKL